jgi:hypothetical protein
MCQGEYCDFETNVVMENSTTPPEQVIDVATCITAPAASKKAQG